MSGSGYRAHPSDGKEILRVLESSAAAGRVEVVFFAASRCLRVLYEGVR